jgi:fibrillarin-like rRNA methylase
MELKESLYSTGTAFVWTKQQECNLIETTKVLKDHCNNTEGQNILANLSEKTTLTLYGEMNFSWGKRLYIEWYSRRERSGIAGLHAGLTIERNEKEHR